MANELLRITPAGGTFASLDGAKDAFDQKIVDAFGGDIDKHTHTPQEQFSSINASVWGEMVEELARAISYGTDLDTAQGKFLDAMGTLLDIRRRQATKTRVLCQSTGRAGLVVPKGSIVQDAAGNRYVSDLDVSLRPNGEETDIPFTAIEYGPTIVLSGAVNKIVSVLNGWDTITNNEDGITGTDRETDTEYRANIKARTAKNATASRSALESALSEAGATSFRVIENPSNLVTTIGGVSIPPHSVVVAAGGGLMDDIARAINNNRGMGVNVLGAIEGRSDYSKSLVSNMNSARFMFNGTTFKDIDLSSAASTSAIASILSALPNTGNRPSFSSTGTSLVAFYNYLDDDDQGFEDVDGQITDEIEVEKGFHVVSGYVCNQKARLKFTQDIESIGTGNDRPRISYVPAGSSSRTSINTNSTSAIYGDMLVLDMASALPTGATAVRAELTNASGSTKNVRSVNGLYATRAVDMEVLDYDSSDAAPATAPVHVSTWVRARNAGCRVMADAFVTNGQHDIAKWQYRRFDGVRILPSDTNWEDVPSSASQTINVTLGGLSNSRTGARIELRAVVNDSNRTFASTDTFNPSATRPTIVQDDTYADGESIVIATSVGLRPKLLEATDDWTVTLTGGGSRTITHQRVKGNKIYLTVNTALPEGRQNVRVAYAQPSINDRIFSVSGIAMNGFGSRIIRNNKTIDKLPARPAFVYAYTTYENAAGTTIEWTSNANGGSNVDQYEYRTREVDSAQWSDWKVVGGGNTRSTSFLRNTGYVQMRASNPNIRFANIFGLSTGSIPFMRPVKFPLEIGIDLRQSDQLTGDVIDSIRASIVSTISGYDLGARLWANDIFAQVERVAGTEVKFDSSNTYVRYRGRGVNASNAYAVPLYAEWSVDPSDISIIFTT